MSMAARKYTEPTGLPRRCEGWSKVSLLDAGWRRKRYSPFSGMNLKVFLVPAIIMAVGAAIWAWALLCNPDNYPVILVGELLVAIGLFTFILLGFWLMTLIRIR